MLTAPAPAKLNLTLRVGPRRPDGYHDIESLVVQLDLADTVAVQAAPPHEYQLTCSDPTLPTDDRNLVYHAARLLAQYTEFTGGASMHVEKRIPAGAGLGGGSSDAATTLKLLNDFWGTGLEEDDLRTIAMQLGSDVPVFLQRGPAIIRGRGERVMPIKLQTSGVAVLMMPEMHCSTPEVYAKFDTLDPPPTRLSPVYFASALRSPIDLLHAAYNDLEPAAFAVQPALGRLLRLLIQHTDQPIRMSGSGSTLYTLCADETSAEAIRAQWQKLAPTTRVALARF